MPLLKDGHHRICGHTGQCEGGFESELSVYRQRPCLCRAGRDVLGPYQGPGLKRKMLRHALRLRCLARNISNRFFAAPVVGGGHVHSLETAVLAEADEVSFFARQQYRGLPTIRKFQVHLFNHERRKRKSVECC